MDVGKKGIYKALITDMGVNEAGYSQLFKPAGGAYMMFGGGAFDNGKAIYTGGDVIFPSPPSLLGHPVIVSNNSLVTLKGSKIYNSFGRVCHLAIKEAKADGWGFMSMIESGETIVDFHKGGTLWYKIK
jgi:hypothetical protein